MTSTWQQGCASPTDIRPQGRRSPASVLDDPPPSSPRLSIAIDGPAGAGKSTVARAVAARLGYTYADTGAMYRALAWTSLERGIELDDVEAIVRLAQTIEIRLQPALSAADPTRVFVDDHEVTGSIRTPQVSALTSPISAIPDVRHRMVALQKAMAKAGGIVMEGRDIGTVVIPDADVKVFLTASPLSRTARRSAELQARGLAVDFERLLGEIQERDARDAGRATAPMVAAEDAVTINCDSLSAEEVVSLILDRVREVATPHG